MDTNPRILLVKEAAELLQQIRAAHSESDRTLVQSLDRVIELLDECVSERRVETERISGIFKVLAQAIATLPSIVRLIEMMKDDK